jgi:diguanylate cyclase
VRDFRARAEERLLEQTTRTDSMRSRVAALEHETRDLQGKLDSYGHRAGDRVLQSVARCFALGVRSTDFVARVGGEEFAMVMIGLGMDTAMRMANELRAAVEALRFHFRGTPVRVTVSCGFTEIKDRESHETAFDRADAALYRAKNGGKNLCVAA